MAGEEEKKLEDSLSRVRKLCRTAQRGCILVAIVVFAFAAVALCTLCFNAADLLSICAGCFFLIMAETVIITAALFFAGVAQGHSPFSLKQVNLIRVEAFCFLMLAFCDLLFSSTTLSALQPLFGMDAGMISEGSLLASHTAKVNFGYIMVAVLLYCFSIIFKYADLLQESADDTL